VPLVITNVVMVGGAEVAVTWQTVPNFTYQLQYKDQLDAGEWQAMMPNITATNGWVTVTNSVGIQTQRFYRILLVP
jgi:major membrane immunogen (membrane-anchored lipoprotein)